MKSDFNGLARPYLIPSPDREFDNWQGGFLDFDRTRMKFPKPPADWQLSLREWEVGYWAVQLALRNIREGMLDPTNTGDDMKAFQEMLDELNQLCPEAAEELNKESAVAAVSGSIPLKRDSQTDGQSGPERR